MQKKLERAETLGRTVYGLQMEVEQSTRALEALKLKIIDETNQKISIERSNMAKRLEKNVRNARVETVSAAKRREKEKERQKKRYITSSTREYKERRNELLRQNKADMRVNHVPVGINRSWWFRLFMPCSLMDAGILIFLTLLLCLLLPFALYLLLPQRQSWHFFLIMPICDFLFLMAYLEIRSFTVGKHKEVLMRCRQRMIMVRELKKQISQTKLSIIELDDEKNYMLEKQDTRLVNARQSLELANTAMNTEITRFENEITRDIRNSYEDRFRAERMELEKKITQLTREKNLSVELLGEVQLELTDHYEDILGADCLNLTRVRNMISWLTYGDADSLEDCLERVRTSGS